MHCLQIVLNDAEIWMNFRNERFSILSTLTVLIFFVFNGCHVEDPTNADPKSCSEAPKSWGSHGYHYPINFIVFRKHCTKPLKMQDHRQRNDKDPKMLSNFAQFLMS